MGIHNVITLIHSEAHIYDNWPLCIYHYNTSVCYAFVNEMFLCISWNASKDLDKRTL